MFKRPQDKRSSSTKCSNLSGEEFFPPSTAVKKHDDRRAFKRVLNSDHGFGAASRTLETKMVMYIITAKLNLTFGTIGKATAVKRLQKTAKVVGINSSCRFSVKN